MKQQLFVAFCLLIWSVKATYAQHVFPDGTSITEWFLFAEGGGVVYIPNGIYKSGALNFKQGTHLYLAEGAVLLGSDNIADFPLVMTRIEGQYCKYFPALINVENLNGFSISGKGTIDGNGSPYWKAFRLRRQWNPECTNKDEMRPDTPQLYEYITLQNITGTCRDFIAIHSWKQFLDLKGRTSFLKSYGRNIMVEGIDVNADKFVSVVKNDAEYELSDFHFYDIKGTTLHPQWDTSAVKGLRMKNVKLCLPEDELAGSVDKTNACLPVAKPKHVFITAGQSNTDGRVPNEQLPEYIKHLSTDTVDYSEGAYRLCRIAQNDSQGRFFPFWPRATRKGNTNLWGYDAVTYYWLEQLLQEEFYVIKWAVGGTSIAPNYKSQVGRYWSADPEWLSNTKSTSKGGRSLLLSLVEEIDTCIEQTLSRLPEGYQIDAFLWHQGESDYRKGGEYYNNLKTLVNYVRMRISQKTGKDYSRLPFILGTVSKSNKCYSVEVEKAMKRLEAENPDTYLVDMSQASLQRDQLHFTAESAEYLGKAVYEILAKLISPL